MYLDTSAAVKLYVREEDSDALEAIVRGADLVSSDLLYCELRSAFLAKERAGFCSGEQVAATWDLFEQHLRERRVRLVPIDRMIVREASALMAGLHPDSSLRSLDAIHLATCLGVDAGPLLTRDRRMESAARRLNVPLAALS